MNSESVYLALNDREQMRIVELKEIRQGDSYTHDDLMRFIGSELDSLRLTYAILKLSETLEKNGKT